MPSVLGGTNWPSLRTWRSRARTAERDAGETPVAWPSMKDCRENGGGFTGTGCVAQARSPFRSDAGTRRSSIGKSGSPVSRSHDQEVAVHGAGRPRKHGQARGVPAEPLAQVHAAALAEAENEPAGAGVEGEEIPAGAVEHAPLLSVAPDHDPAVHPEGRLLRAGRGRAEAPLLAPGGGVEREGLQPRRRGVKDAVHHDRVALDLRAAVRACVAAVVGPGDRQPFHVAGVDLREGRVLRGAGVPACTRHSRSGATRAGASAAGPRAAPRAGDRARRDTTATGRERRFMGAEDKGLSGPRQRASTTGRPLCIVSPNARRRPTGRSATRR